MCPPAGERSPHLIMARATRQFIWAGAAFFEAVFDVHRNTLIDRMVAKEETEDGVKYEVGDFYKKCADLILKRLLAASEADADDVTGLTAGQLKAAKLSEEVRKLRLANDVEERELVPRSEVLPLYMRGMKRVAEKLDRIPLKIKMKAPDIQPAILTVISDAIAEARNEAAKDDIWKETA